MYIFSLVVNKNQEKRLKYEFSLKEFLNFIFKFMTELFFYENPFNKISFNFDFLY
jgi:hypothetical protein